MAKGIVITNHQMHGITDALDTSPYGGFLANLHITPGKANSFSVLVVTAAHGEVGHIEVDNMGNGEWHSGT